MTTKVSKTARASSGKVKAKFLKPCPECGVGMVATRVITKPRGMYWVCQHCDYRVKI